MYSTLQLTLSLTKEVYIRPPECHTTTQDVYIRPQTRSISSCPVVQDCMNKFNLVVEKGLALMLKSRRLHKVPWIFLENISNVSGTITPRLMEDLLGKGYHVYVDTWYTSEALFTYLYKNSTATCGMARKNRLWLPATFKNPNIPQEAWKHVGHSFQWQKGKISYLLFTRPMSSTQESVTTKAMLWESSNWFTTTTDAWVVLTGMIKRLAPTLASERAWSGLKRLHLTS